MTSTEITALWREWWIAQVATEIAVEQRTYSTWELAATQGHWAAEISHSDRLDWAIWTGQEL